MVSPLKKVTGFHDTYCDSLCWESLRVPTFQRQESGYNITSSHLIVVLCIVIMTAFIHQITACISNMHQLSSCNLSYSPHYYYFWHPNKRCFYCSQIFTLLAWLIYKPNSLLFDHAKTLPLLLCFPCDQAIRKEV